MLIVKIVFIFVLKLIYLLNAVVIVLLLLKLWLKPCYLSDYVSIGLIALIAVDANRHQQVLSARRHLERNKIKTFNISGRVLSEITFGLDNHPSSLEVAIALTSPKPHVL